jgi:putative endonuclease
MTKYDFFKIPRRLCGGEVHYEHYLDAENAIRREKRLKKYNRKWKIDLIEKMNPNWKDLYRGLISGLPDQVGQ